MESLAHARERENEMNNMFQSMQQLLSGNSPFMAFASKGIDMYWREALLDAAQNPRGTMIRASRLFDPRKLPTVQVAASYLDYRERAIDDIKTTTTYRLTFNGKICSSLSGPLRALLRAAMPRNRAMRLTTSTCRGFEELAAVASDKATSAYIQSTIRRLREADGGVMAIVDDDTIFSLQYVKPSNLLQRIPSENVEQVLQQLAGSASICLTDDQVISRLDNRVLDRLQAGLTDVIHVRPELTASELIQAIQDGAGRAELGTKKLILSYKHEFDEATGRTWLVDSESRCAEIVTCLKRFFNNQKVQLWIDEILSRVNKTWFSSWVEVGLSPYTSAEVLILNDERYDLNSMWLNIELNMAILCRGAIVTREEGFWPLVSKLTAQSLWYRSGTHIQGGGLSPEKALRMLLCRWISGIIPQNARDPADVKMLDQMADSFLNSTDVGSLTHSELTDFEKARILSGSLYMEMFSILHDVRNEYGCFQLLNRQTIFDAMYPRMPRVSEKMIQRIAAVEPIDMSRCFDAGNCYLYFAVVGNALNAKPVVMQMMKSQTITGEDVVKTTVRHDDARIRYMMQRSLDMAYDVHHANEETADNLAISTLLVVLSGSGEFTGMDENIFQDQAWTRACSDDVVLNALGDSGFRFTTLGGQLGEIRGFDNFLPVELTGTASYFQLPYNATSNVSNRSQMRLNPDDIVRSTVRHAGTIAESLKQEVEIEPEKELVDLENESTFLVLQNRRIRVAWQRNDELFLLLGNLPILQAVAVKKDEYALLSPVSLTAYHGSVEDRNSGSPVSRKNGRSSSISRNGMGNSNTRKMQILSRKAIELNIRTLRELNYNNTSLQSFLQMPNAARDTLEALQRGAGDTSPKMLAMISYMQNEPKNLRRRHSRCRIA